MSEDMQHIAADIVEQAISWHMQANEGAGDESGLLRWLAADARHQLAYDRIAGIWHQLENLPPNAAKAGLTAAPKKEQVRKQLRSGGKVFSVALLAGFAAYMTSQSQPYQIYMAEYRNAIGAPRTITLADNSRLSMNSNTVLDIDFDGKQRLIKLHQGEIVITVAKDPNRPLIVATQHGTAQALGTRFDVNLQNDHTQVAVIESQVKACNKPGLFSFAQPSCTTLLPGQAIRLAYPQTQQIQAVNADAVGVWQSGVLALDNQPLDQVLNTLQAYTTRPIQYNASAVRHIKISGVLPLNDIPRSLSLISSRFPVTVTQGQNNSLMIGTR